MKEYNIKNLTAYLHRVNDRLEQYVTAIRADIEQSVVTWPECGQLAEASNLAEWIGYQVHQLEGIAKEQRFNLGDLYRCKQSDPLGVIKQGKIYRLHKWDGEYIVRGEGFAINEAAMQAYFERVPEPEDKPTT